MAFTYLGCLGFELKAVGIFDVSGGVLTAFETTLVAHSRSRYAYDSNRGLGQFSLRETTPTNHGSGIGHWIAWNHYLGSNDNDLLHFRDDLGVSHLRIGRETNGKLGAHNGAGTLVASSTNLYPLTAFNSLQVFILVADSGGRYKIIVNGVTEIDFTGDTRNGSNTNIAAVLLNDTGTQVNCHDDFVWGTGTDTDNPGSVKVAGPYPSADGNANQLDKSPASVSRFYMPSDDTASPDPNFAAISPAFDGAWEETGAAIRRQLGVAKGASASSSETFTYSGLSASDDLLWYQFVSPPIAAQTVSGTVKGQVRVAEGASTDDERAQVVIRVLSNDGSTVRGTLLAASAASLSSELSTTLTNRKFPLAAISPATLSSVAASAEDRIVVEIGVRHHGATTTSAAIAVAGEDSGSDLAEDETDTTGDPWIEFSAAITMTTSGKGNHEYAAEGPSDDTSLVYSTTVDEKDLYVAEDVSSTDSIIGVSLYARGRRSDAGPGKVALGVRRSGTESFGSDLGLPLGFGVVTRDLALDPTDSSVWSASKVNATEIGWKVR